MWRTTATYVLVVLGFAVAVRGDGPAGPTFPVNGLAGPAHAQWGSTIACSLPPSAEASAGQCTWRLRQRGRDEIFAGGNVLKCQRAVDARISLSLKLPAAPDPVGNADGDFDLSFIVAADDGQIELGSAHPIHIETRDRAGRIAGRYVPRNYDLFAATSGPAEISPDWLTRNGIRHGRRDAGWGSFEPEDGKWEVNEFEKLERILTLARRYDMTVLPILTGTPAWASFDDEGGWKPAKDPERWAAFVDRVVGHFSKAPYYQRHWQVWNEAPANPFWPTDVPLETYIDKVHNPAARAIRKHYADLNGNGERDDGEQCLVVYGGWPCTHWQGGQYAKALATNGCGELTDILDAHYVQGLRWFERGWSGNVYQTWMKSGKAKGCWQTEMGWGLATPPHWLPYTFFQDIGWSLGHEWDRKDKYRDYFFHYYAAQPKHGLYWSDPEPKWPNGYSMRTLMRVTRGDLALPGPGRVIEAENGSASYSDIHKTVVPILAGGRLVFIFWPGSESKPGVALFKIKLKPGEVVKRVQRVSLAKGNTSSVDFTTSDGLLRFDLPWQPAEATEEQFDAPLSPFCYVVVECEAPMTPWPAHAQLDRRSRFAQFVGVVQGSPSADQADLWKHITFARHDLSWGTLQPNGRDEWNQEHLDNWGKMVLESRKHGVEVLPTLDYLVDWAARRSAWSFTVGDVRYDVAEAEGNGPRKAVAVNLKTGERQNTSFSPERMPPEDVRDWENYVDRVVAFLSKPPYNVKYFQPWNEAHDEFTGFWAGGLDEYMRTIHMPAARTIRKHGGKVVFGGYPCCGSMKRFVEICDKYNAWDTLDVMDVHYFPLSSWQYLYDRAVKPGKVWGLWQTEVGFTGDTGWIPNNFPRFFHWALRHDWEPDRYRLFHFAYWSPNDPKAYGYKCGLMLGDDLSHHGKALTTLGELLDSPRIVPFNDWRSEPPLRTELSENLSSVEAFDTGKSIVLVMHLLKDNTAAIFTDRNGERDNLHIDWPTTKMRLFLPTTAPGGVQSAERIGIYGARLPLAIEPSGAGMAVNVPVTDADAAARRDNRATTATTFYVVVTRK